MLHAHWCLVYNPGYHIIVNIGLQLFRAIHKEIIIKKLGFNVFGYTWHLRKSPVDELLWGLSADWADTGKFDRGLKTILHDELHWLDVPERIEYKLGVIKWWCIWCLHGQAPRYLADHLIPASDAAPRRGRQPELSHCASLSTQHVYGCRAFDCRPDSLELAIPDKLRIQTVWIV